LKCTKKELFKKRFMSAEVLVHINTDPVPAGLKTQAKLLAFKVLAEKRKFGEWLCWWTVHDDGSLTIHCSQEESEGNLRVTLHNEDF
jgi:hypothetical protein